MTSEERRNKGLLFIADESDWEKMKRARRLTRKLNTADPADFDLIRSIVNELFGKSDSTTFVNPPFFCDYGSNIEVGKSCFINYNCVILDNGRVTIGDNCLIGPNAAIYTAGHPLHPDLRRPGYEYGIGVEIEDDVWIGGNAVICPGVRIGRGSVIGAGSVVTRDVPEMSFAAGNPCRVIRPITDADREYYFRQRKIDEELAGVLGIGNG